jgi:hypothetical protein
MSIRRKISLKIKKIYRAFLTAIDFVATPMLRIFKPAEHKYPASGVQPYEGEPNKDK